MYWWENSDGAGHALSGVLDYIMHFPAGGLPPNHPFWSLTMGDARNHFVANPINRYSVGGISSNAGGISSNAGERSSLTPDPDGSVDIYIQKAVPAGHESNWLRLYIPGEAILDGKYTMPPVMKVK